MTRLLTAAMLLATLTACGAYHGDDDTASRSDRYMQSDSSNRGSAGGNGGY